MSPVKPFRATSGLDAGGEKVINVATGDIAVLSDGVNVDFFIQYNTIQPYDSTRGYDKYFAVIYDQRIWYALENIAKPCGAFDSKKWKSLRVDPQWQYINSTIPEGTNILSGDYVMADNRYNNLKFVMPLNPQPGDTIVVKDVGGQPGVNELFFKSPGAAKFEVLGKAQDDFRSTIPFSQILFIYNDASKNWVINIDAQQDQSYYVQPGAKPFQLQSSFKTWRRTGLGQIDLQLPRYANHGDFIQTFDIDGMNAINHSTIRVHPDSTHSVGTAGTTILESRTSGNGYFVFDANSDLWRVWDGDQRTRMKIVRLDYELLPFDHVLVSGDPNVASQNVTLTLPTDVEYGDSVKITLDFLRKGQTCTIKVKDGSGNVIVGDKAQYQFQRRSEYPAIGDWPTVEQLVFDADTDYVPFIELVYAQVSRNVDAWVPADVVPKVERVDATKRSRLGVAALASQSEVNKNYEDRPNDETIVTPLTLASKTATETRRGIARIATTAEVNQVTTADFLDDVIITPKKLNERTATETRRGVAEVATQVETNAGTDDATIVTPKKLNDRKASPTLTGILALVNTGGAEGADRSTAGTGVYNKGDFEKAVTPKTLDEFVATEKAKGVAYLATANEVINGAEDAGRPLIVTPVQLHKKTATETRIGFSEIATQQEVNDGTDDFRFITPKKLEARKATEALGGITEVATQPEVDAGTDDYRFVTPKKLKAKFDDAAHVAVDAASGLTKAGTIWGTVSLNIVAASEAQRGTARLATQAETNAGTDDATIVTPKKLHAKKATTTTEGIVRCATDAEASAGTATNLAVTPATMKYLNGNDPSWGATETRRGAVFITSMDSTFVGNDTDGSTQPYTDYAHDYYAVSPKGLNYALQNFLPKMATAQNSLKLNGVAAADWVRRTVAQTITGELTLTQPLTVNSSIRGESINGNTLTVRANGISAVSVGTVGAADTAGIRLFAKHNTDAKVNNWSMYAGGGTSAYVGAGEVGFVVLKDDGSAAVSTPFKMNRDGDIFAKRDATARKYIATDLAGYFLGSSASSNQVIGISGGDTIQFGNTSKKARVYVPSVNDFTLMAGSNTYTVLHTGNFAAQQDGTYVRRDGTTSMSGTLNVNAGVGLAVTNATYPGIKLTATGNDAATRHKQIEVSNDGALSIITRNATNANNGVVTIAPGKSGEVYHTGNKPTPAEIGAVAVAGSTIDTLVVRNWIKIGNVKIVANNVTKTVEFLWEE